jgi:lipopolysaccharide biosynthesis glycosyltransferase
VKVYIGFDEREVLACDAACKSLYARSKDVQLTLLDSHRLASWGLLRRPVDRRGQKYDILSGAHASTDFAISRFLVPLLAQQGWALFTDCDVLFLADVNELLSLRDPKYAVMVVKHEQEVRPGEGTKMDGQIQSAYGRKNWSSVVLWNCDHPANRRISLADIQERRGLDLHQFYWLHDSEIGSLPPEWNWLVGVEPKPAEPKIAHFTLGGPWIPNWEPREYDDLWYREACLSRVDSPIT